MGKIFFLLLLILLLLVGCRDREKEKLYSEIESLERERASSKAERRNLHTEIKFLHTENDKLKLKIMKSQETLDLVMQVNFIGKIPQPPPTDKSSGIYKEVFNPNYRPRNVQKTVFLICNIFNHLILLI
jgi:hypothetical protein